MMCCVVPITVLIDSAVYILGVLACQIGRGF